MGDAWCPSGLRTTELCHPCDRRSCTRFLVHDHHRQQSNVDTGSHHCCAATNALFLAGLLATASNDMQSAPEFQLRFPSSHSHRKRAMPASYRRPLADVLAHRGWLLFVYAGPPMTQIKASDHSIVHACAYRSLFMPEAAHSGPRLWPTYSGIQFVSTMRNAL